MNYELCHLRGRIIITAYCLTRSYMLSGECRPPSPPLIFALLSAYKIDILTLIREVMSIPYERR